MFAIALALAASLFSDAAGTSAWRCRNELEIWCSEKGCTLSPKGETTPLDIFADPKRGFSICAYSGCWEGKAAAKRVGGRLLWTKTAAPFSTAGGGRMSADVTLLIFETDGVGFVRAGGLATPLLCVRGAQRAE